MISLFFSYQFVIGLAIGILLVIYIIGITCNSNFIYMDNINKIMNPLLMSFRQDKQRGVEHFLKDYLAGKKAIIYRKRMEPSAIQLFYALSIYTAHTYANGKYGVDEKSELYSIIEYIYGSDSYAGKKFYIIEQLIISSPKFFIKSKVKHGSFKDYAVEEFYDMICTILVTCDETMICFKD